MAAWSKPRVRRSGPSRDSLSLCRGRFGEGAAVVQQQKSRRKARARKAGASAAFARYADFLYRDALCKPTDDHVQGPFYRPDAPFLTDIYPADSSGPVLYFDATFADSTCTRLADISVELWQADDAG